jgi:hypothetical protein
MRTSIAAAAGAVLFGSVLLLPVATKAQNAAGIPGVLNPATGMFTSRPALIPATTGLKRSATITVTVTAVLGSNIPTSAPVTCTAIIGSFDNEFTNSASASTALVRTSTGGTCQVAIPYIFEIATAKTLMTVTASISASTIKPPFLTYTASRSFTPFAVPSSNQSVSLSLAL